MSSLQSFQTVRHDLRKVRISAGVARRSGVEGVELEGDVRLRVDDVELRLHYLVGLAVRVGVGFGLVGGGGGRGRGGMEEDDFWEAKGRRVVVLGFWVSSTIFLFFIIFKIDKFIF